MMGSDQVKLVLWAVFFLTFVDHQICVWGVVWGLIARGCLLLYLLVVLGQTCVGGVSGVPVLIMFINTVSFRM